MKGRAAPLAAVLLVGAPPGTALAGAWGRTLGQAYVKAGADLYLSTDHQDLSGRRVEGTVYSSVSPGFYAEVGLLPRWPLHLAVAVPFSIATLRFADPDRFGEGAFGRATTARPGDLRANLHLQLNDRLVQVALEGELKLPLYENGRIGSSFGPWQDVFPLPGDGQVDLGLSLWIGGGIGPAPLWGELSLGHLHRTEWWVGWAPDAILSDAVIGRAALGLRLPRGGLRFGAEGQHAVVVDEHSRSWLALSVSGWLELGHGVALELRGAGEPWARNAGRGLSFGGGLSRRFDGPRR